jgi:hypothetical protein
MCDRYSYKAWNDQRNPGSEEWSGLFVFADPSRETLPLRPTVLKCSHRPSSDAADVQPEGGAPCVNSARRDLCGGRSTIGVPTTTIAA